MESHVDPVSATAPLLTPQDQTPSPLVTPWYLHDAIQMTES